MGGYIAMLVVRWALDDVVLVESWYLEVIIMESRRSS